MGRAPRFLVFLPVRDGQRYVAQAMASVLAQTQGDLRLFVLDNRSRDGTLATVRAFTDPRVETREAEADLSIERSWGRIREVLAEEDRGEALATILGHDDLLYPGFLAEIDRLAERHPRAGLYQTHFDIIGADGQVLRACRPIPEAESAAEFLRARSLQRRDSFGTGYVFRAREYLAVGGIPEFPRLLFADDALVVRLATHSYKAASPAVAFAYRLHGASASGAPTLSRDRDLLRALDLWQQEVRGLHPGLVQDQAGREALGGLIAWNLEATRLGLAERLVAPEYREVRRRLAAASTDLLGAPWTGRRTGVARVVHGLAVQVLGAWRVLAARRATGR